MKGKNYIILPLVLGGLVVLMILTFVGTNLFRDTINDEEQGQVFDEAYDYFEGLEADTGWYSEDQHTFYIHTAEELAGLSELVADGNSFQAKTIILEADITGFSFLKPIGTEETPFSGIFDGQGHMIMGTLSPDEYGGLFGCTENAMISDIGVVALGASGDKATGALIGYARDTVIKKCYAEDGMVMDKSCGGLVGKAENCVFSGCYTNGNASLTIDMFGYDSKEEYCGGFVGYAEDCVFDHCYANMDVYSTGSEEGPDVYGVVAGKLINCSAYSFYYNTENGYLSACADKGELPDGFIEITGYEISALRALMDMNENGEFEWQYAVSEGGGYMRVIEPRFKGTAYPIDTVYNLEDSVLYIAGEYEERSATEEEMVQYGTDIIIEITTKEELAAVVVACMEGETFAGKTLLLMNDLDLHRYQWLPLGNYYAADNGIMGETWNFCGNIDGQGHKIKNLYIHTANGTCGFVGQTGNGAVIIENLTIENCYIRGAMYVSGMVGSGNATDLTLYNNRVSGRIQGNFSSAFATMCGQVLLNKCEAKVTMEDSGESDGLTVRSGVISSEDCTYTEIP